MNTEIIERKIVKMAEQVGSSRRPNNKDVEQDLQRIEAELLAVFERCDAPPVNVFAPLGAPEVREKIIFMDPEYAILRAAPNPFLYIMKKFPADFERVVGHMYMAVPKLLEKAIQVGVPISLFLSKKNERGETYYIEPACQVPLRTLEDAVYHYSNVRLNHASEDCYRYEIRCFIECVQMLVRIGSHVNCRDGDGVTLLMHVLNLDEPRVMQDIIPFLIGLGALPDMPNGFTDGSTPLHKAMDYFGDPIDLGVIKALLECPYPLDLAVSDHGGDTPLDSCVTGANIPLEAIQLYLERDQKQVAQGINSGLLSVRFHNNPILYRLAERGKYPHFEELSDLLIKHGASVTMRLNKDGKMPYYDKEGKFHVLEGSPMIDAILENREGIFSERVIAYYRKKKTELGL